MLRAKAVLAAVVAAAMATGPACSERNAEHADPQTLDLTSLLATADTAGYARADGPRDFTFPSDHGPHPSFRTEWWYVTGNLTSSDGHTFGCQLTFFRSALAPKRDPGTSAWRSNQAWMAHFAVTDVTAGLHHNFERFSRGGNALAGASATPFRVWLDDWHIEGTTAAPVPDMTLAARDAGVSLQLALTSTKPVVLQGDDGLSRKGDGAGNASYYYSLTRLNARGTLTLGDDTTRVTGTAWLDREWSTSALEANQVGWDWFALQFSDTTEFMYYQLRNNDGTVSPHSRGIMVEPSGRSRVIRPETVDIDIVDSWRTYPSGWRIRVRDIDMDVTVTPLLKNQELNLSIRYWEGAVRVSGTRSQHAVAGSGYVELTGYAARADAAGQP